MSIEQKIKEILSKVEYRDTNPIDAEFISYFELDKKEAYLQANLPEDTTDSERKKFGEDVTKALKTLEEIDQVKINFVAPEAKKVEPSPKNVAPQRNAYLQNYENVVLVASGKGGVGKSTVALNLALALKQTGAQVSMLDADVYGPSLPLMTGLRSQKLKTSGNQILPLTRFGIEFVSVGNLISEGESVIWRGPMVHQALEQLIRDTVWPGGDYMIIDMPPGTGDIAITLSQITEAVGAVIVCTPQDVALIDARRALAMFEKVNVPVLGVVENMSGFSCPHCGKSSLIFGQGGAQKDSKNFGIPFLGSIPIELKIREGSDSGTPILASEPEGEIADCYLQISKNLTREIEGLNNE